MDVFETREPSWISALHSDFLLSAYGSTFHLHLIPMALRSAKIAKIIPERHQGLFYYSFNDIPGDAETFELAVKFCHSSKLEITAQNVVPLYCIAAYLEMTEDHSPNNLLNKTELFFNKRVLSNWNDTVRALKTCEDCPRPATELGLVEKCLDTIAGKALDDPSLLGQPIKDPAMICPKSEPHSLNRYVKNTKRKLFVVDWSFEDLTTLNLALYNLVISVMIQRGMPPEIIAGSLFQYVKQRINIGIGDEEGFHKGLPLYDKNSQRQIIETVEKLLPEKKGVVPCKCLLELLRSAMALQACEDCRNGLEVRIGKQLEEAVLEDLLIPSHGYTQETKFDIDCITRIFQNFYENSALRPFQTLKTTVALLVEVAADPNLKIKDFISLVDAMKIEFWNCSDDLYRAIDAYLVAHRFITDSEREEVCQVLDCRKLSQVAWEHAAMNERLPLRLVVQVLHIGQLQLSEAIVGSLPDSGDVCSPERVDDGDEGAVRSEIERMDFRVTELEKECCLMKEELRRGKKGKGGFLRELWRKFGCTPTIQACHEKKVHPKNY